MFDLGMLIATKAVVSEVGEKEIGKALFKHLNGDYGVVSDDDKQANVDALKNGDRLLSAYISGKGVKFWIITEGDRSRTTVLLPSEY